MAILDVQHIERAAAPRSSGTSTLSLEEGQVLAIIGSSGAGKTTFGRTELPGDPRPGDHLRPGRGPLRRRRPLPPSGEGGEIRRKRLHFGLVFQNFNLFPQYTALQNVTLARELMARGENRGGPGRHPGRGERLLTQMGLQDRMGNYPHQLSGGQQRGGHRPGPGHEAGHPLL